MATYFLFCYLNYVCLFTPLWVLFIVVVIFHLFHCPCSSSGSCGKIVSGPCLSSGSCGSIVFGPCLSSGSCGRIVAGTLPCWSSGHGIDLISGWNWKTIDLSSQFDPKENCLSGKRSSKGVCEGLKKFCTIIYWTETQRNFQASHWTSYMEYFWETTEILKMYVTY